MGHLGDLIQGYQDQHGASQNFIAEKVGVSSTIIGRWKRGDFVEIPKRDLLVALAAQINVKLEVVIEAALNDTYFRDEPVDVAARTGRTRRGPREQRGD